MRYLLTVSLLLIVCSAKATIINVGSSSEFTDAVLITAQESDTVLVTNSFALASTVVINRNISFTIAGQGTNNTTITLNGGTIWVVSDSSNVFTIRDFTLGFTTANSGSYGILIGHSGYEFPGPYHIYNVCATNVCGRGISMGAGKSHNSYGLIDHCSFWPETNGHWQQAIDFSGAGTAAWTNASPLGTTNVSCVEDNYFWTATNGNAGNGFFDAYVGAQVCIRHNIFDGFAPIGGHGYDSQPQSIRTWEIYNNVFTNSLDPNSLMIWRGGSGVVFSNQCYGTFNSVSTLLCYRATPELFPNPATRSGYLTFGVPGQGYIINFQNTPAQGGVDMVFNGQPTNTEFIVVGHTLYFFLTSLSTMTNDFGTNSFNSTGKNNDGYFGGSTFGASDFSTFGGGGVLIGATVAQTITNWFNAINLVPNQLGITYSNYPGVRYTNGYEFIATGYDAHNLYLTNALDCNTNIYGYPSYNQCGVIGNLAPLTGTNFVQVAVKFPAYCWGNTINGVSSNNMTIGTQGTYMTNLVLLNRDYFNDVAPATNIYLSLVYPHPLATVTNPPPVTVNAYISLPGGLSIPGGVSFR